MHSTFRIAKTGSARSLIKGASSNISKVWNSKNAAPQPVISKYSWKKKIALISGVVVGVPSLVGSIWYFQADPQDQRRARVTVQGGGRFLRYLNTIYNSFVTYLLIYTF